MEAAEVALEALRERVAELEVEANVWREREASALGHGEDWNTFHYPFFVTYRSKPIQSPSPQYQVCRTRNSHPWRVFNSRSKTSASKMH
jgi:hypothetical protein